MGINNKVFVKRNLDEEEIPDTKTVQVESVVENKQLSLLDEALRESKIKSYQELNSNAVVDNLYVEY